MLTLMNLKGQAVHSQPDVLASLAPGLPAWPDSILTRFVCTALLKLAGITDSKFLTRWETQ